MSSGNLAISLLCMTIATAMMWTAYTVFWAIPPEYIKGPAAAGGIALINTIGLSGGFWGPALIGWAKTATGSLHPGVLIMAVMPLVAALILLANKMPARR